MPASPSDPVLNGHALAGLIDAEAHFAITEHNGGGSVSCTMVLALRDDDVDLLHDAARITGLGTVRPKDQRGNPQVAWSVYRKDEASALVAFLERFPLRSRKRLDFQIWSAAVECWQRSCAERLERMKDFRRAISNARTYHLGGRASPASDADRYGFAEWLGGFIAGDGWIGISGGAPRLTVKLRADDAPLLAEIRDITRAGKLNGPYLNRAAGARANTWAHRVRPLASP